jgi:hypothetical protein
MKDSYFYPRFVIRTSKALSVIALALFVMALILISAVAASGRRPLIEEALPLSMSLMAYRLSTRAIVRLQQLELERASPDAEMMLLFDMSLFVTLISMMGVLSSTLLQIRPQ